RCLSNLFLSVLIQSFEVASAETDIVKAVDGGVFQLTLTRQLINLYRTVLLYCLRITTETAFVHLKFQFHLELTRNNSKSLSNQAIVTNLSLPLPANDTKIVFILLNKKNRLHNFTICCLRRW